MLVRVFFLALVGTLFAQSGQAQQYQMLQENGLTAAVDAQDRCAEPSYPLLLVSDDPEALIDEPLVLNTLLKAVGRLSIDCQRTRFLHDVPVVTTGGQWDGAYFLFGQSLPAFTIPASLLTERQENWLRKDPGTFQPVSRQFVNLLSGYWDRTRLLFGGESYMATVTFQFAITDALRCPEVIGDAIEVTWERYWRFGYASGTHSGSFRYDEDWAPLVERILQDGHASGRELGDFARRLIAEYGCSSKEINGLRRAMLDFGKAAYGLEDLAVPDYEDAPEIPVIAVPDAQADFTMISGGQSYDAEDVANFLALWRKAIRTGFNPSLPDPRFALLKDDAGEVYVATDAEGAFAIHRMDLTWLKEIYTEAIAVTDRPAQIKAMEEAQALAMERDPAFAFLARLNSPTRAEDDLLRSRAYDNAKGIAFWMPHLEEHMRSVANK